MHHDDQPVGRLLSRREMLAMLGVSGAALLSGCSPDARNGAYTVQLPDCVVRPQQTQGPYFVDVMLNRSDIRADPATGITKEGLPLALSFNVLRVTGDSCAALSGAQVDVWQCDADGVYSDVRDPRFTTVGQRFLRGYQLTDSDGVARFTTIYPGWYPGRTVHIHFKVRTPSDADRAYEFISQLYFDDDKTDAVHARSPYASRGQRRTRNTGDGIYRRGGDQLMLALQGDEASGFRSTFSLALRY